MERRLDCWYQDYPRPSDFLNVLLGCGNFHPHSDASPNIAAFCDQSTQSKINQAESMEATDPTGAAKLWTQRGHPEAEHAHLPQHGRPEADRLPVQQRSRLLVEPAVVHPHRQALARVDHR